MKKGLLFALGLVALIIAPACGKKCGPCKPVCAPCPPVTECVTEEVPVKCVRDVKTCTTTSVGPVRWECPDGQVVQMKNKTHLNNNASRGYRRKGRM